MDQSQLTLNQPIELIGDSEIGSMRITEVRGWFSISLHPYRL